MSSLHPGNQLRLTATGELLTIWSPAHLPGCYWAHHHLPNTAPPPLVLIRVRHTKQDANPIVTLVEDQ